MEDQLSALVAQEPTGAFSIKAHSTKPYLTLWLSLRCGGRVVNVSLGVRYPTISFSLHFDHLWLSVMVSIRMSFLDSLLLSFANGVKMT